MDRKQLSKLTTYRLLSDKESKMGRQYAIEIGKYLYSGVINDVSSLITIGNGWQIKQNKKSNDSLSLPNEAEGLKVVYHDILTRASEFSLLKGIYLIEH